MKADTLHILLADYVPLANKGEEAIVRGIEDMLSDGRPIAIGLFDNVTEVTRRDNLTIFPRQWLFRFEGNARLSGRGRLALQMLIALQLRCGLYGRLKNLTHGSDPHCRPLADFFDRADLVLVGHDGVFCVESCGIIHLAKTHGKRAGILGASTGIGGGKLYKAGLYRRALEASDFCIFREPYSCDSMRQVAPDATQLQVGPDPAFAMRAAAPESARQVLESCAGYGPARAAGRPVVAVTVLEKGRVYAGFRPDLHGPAKQQAHAGYLATILDALVERHQAFILFLPHSVEADGSDIVAARHVTEHLKASPADYTILETDCGPRLLKSIIRECDFLVGERTHSLIGSVSVGTPFAALTNRQDTRTHGIIGEMCRCKHQILNMDMMDETAAANKVLEIFASRATVSESLERTRRDLDRQISRMASRVQGQPGRLPAP